MPKQTNDSCINYVHKYYMNAILSAPMQTALTLLRFTKHCTYVHSTWRCHFPWTVHALFVSYVTQPINWSRSALLPDRTIHHKLNINKERLYDDREPTGKQLNCAFLETIIVNNII